MPDIVTTADGELGWQESSKTRSKGDGAEMAMPKGPSDCEVGQRQPPGWATSPTMTEHKTGPGWAEFSVEAPCRAA
jgi:hypothetical protein